MLLILARNSTPAKRLTMGDIKSTKICSRYEGIMNNEIIFLPIAMSKFGNFSRVTCFLKSNKRINIKIIIEKQVQRTSNSEKCEQSALKGKKKLIDNFLIKNCDYFLFSYKSFRERSYSPSAKNLFHRNNKEDRSIQY